LVLGSEVEQVDHEEVRHVAKVIQIVKVTIGPVRVVSMTKEEYHEHGRVCVNGRVRELPNQVRVGNEDSRAEHICNLVHSSLKGGCRHYALQLQLSTLHFLKHLVDLDSVFDAIDKLLASFP